MLRTQPGTTVRQSKQFLARVISHESHQFWPDSISCKELPETGVIGYKQVTDACLVALARHNNGRLATLDRALAALYGDHVTLVA